MLDLPSTSISRRPAAAGAFLLLIALVMTEGGSLGQDGFDPPTPIVQAMRAMGAETLGSP